MKVLILGDKSDIAKGISSLMSKDGWAIQGWNRDTPDNHFRYFDQWDVLLVCVGRVSPVGMWQDQSITQVVDCLYSNLILPLQLVQRAWGRRGESPSVCFMAGSNPQKIMSGYTAYNVGKMGLLKLCEQLDFETPEAKFFALGPGYVQTKIHRATLDAGWKNERIQRGGSTPIETIYDCLKWCLKQPKEVVGGRNICASDPYGDELAQRLSSDPSLFKLRRVQ